MGRAQAADWHLLHSLGVRRSVMKYLLGLTVINLFFSLALLVRQNDIAEKHSLFVRDTVRLIGKEATLTRALTRVVLRKH